jgi:hypothetical protein
VRHGGPSNGRVDLQAHGPAALKLYCHEVTVRFVERAVVPPYEGSMIRGATAGTVLRPIGIVSG